MKYEYWGGETREGQGEEFWWVGWVGEKFLSPEISPSIVWILFPYSMLKVIIEYAVEVQYFVGASRRNKGQRAARIRLFKLGFTLSFKYNLLLLPPDSLKPATFLFALPSSVITSDEIRPYIPTVQPSKVDTLISDHTEQQIQPTSA